MVKKEDIVKVLKEIYDPEIPVNIYDLGLIYGIEIKDGNKVKILMTLTVPGCPLMNYLIAQVQDAVKQIEGVEEVEVEITWEPRWSIEMISEEGKKQLRALGYNV